MWENGMVFWGMHSLVPHSPDLKLQTQKNKKQNTDWKKNDATSSEEGKILIVSFWAALIIVSSHWRPGI